MCRYQMAHQNFPQGKHLFHREKNIILWLLKASLITSRIKIIDSSSYGRGWSAVTFHTRHSHLIKELAKNNTCLSEKPNSSTVYVVCSLWSVLKGGENHVKTWGPWSSKVTYSPFSEEGVQFFCKTLIGNCVHAQKGVHHFKKFKNYFSRKKLKV